VADPVALASLWYAKWTFWVTVSAVAFSSVALVFSGIAIWTAFVAIRRADLNSSAATLVALHEGYRGSWEKFVKAQKAQDNEEMRYQFADVMNLIEINTGLHDAKSLAGVSEELSTAYLKSILRNIRDNTDFVQMISELKDEPKTFHYTKEFCHNHGLREVFPPKLNSQPTMTPSPQPTA
jgi:hypothetical protein